jgi:hypothetical protein
MNHAERAGVTRLVTVYRYGSEACIRAGVAHATAVSRVRSASTRLLGGFGLPGGFGGLSCTKLSQKPQSTRILGEGRGQIEVSGESDG